MNEPVWFRQNRDASEKFAAVLDGDVPGADAPEFADELALVGMLRDLGSEPAMSASSRSRMRAALMLEAEATPLAVVDKDKPEPHPHVATRRIGQVSGKTRRKASLLAAATAAGVVAFGALGIELAQDALPGDLLYDVKRTTETIALDLTFSEDGRALKQLEMAATRIDELAALTERDAADGGATVDEIATYRSVIADLNSTAAAASRGVTSYGPQSDGADLRTLRDWAQQQAAEMETIEPAVPEAVVNEFDASIALIESIGERAEELLARLDCAQITTGHSDRIGALPAEEACQPLDASGPGVSPRSSTEPKVSDEESTKTGDEKPTVPSTGNDPGGVNTPGAGTDPSPGTDTDAPSLDVPELPEAPAKVEKPDTDSETGLQLPLLTELPEIDLGID